MSVQTLPNDLSKPPLLTRTIVVMLFLVGCAALLARLIPGPRTIDDAFITFRYSRNIVEGQGFVYNTGVRSLGTTTPLYTLLMAAIAAISGQGDYPWFAVVVNAVADAGSAALLAWLVFRLTKVWFVAFLTGLIWAVNPMSVTFAIGGMETSVAIFWQIAATVAYVLRRDRWMAVFAGLGILTRIDTLIWVGMLFLHQLVTSIRRSEDDRRHWAVRLPWGSWGMLALVTAPWYLFSVVYFETLLPRSLSAKRLAYVVEDYQALVRLLQHIATPFFGHETLGTVAIAFGLFAYPALAAIGTLYVARRWGRFLPFLLYPWVYFAVFSVMNPVIFRWYLAPMLPAYFFAIVLGCWVLAEGASTALHRTTVGKGLAVTIMVIWIALLLNAWVVHPDHGRDRPAPEMAWHKIELNYRKMAEALRTDFGVDEETLVAAGDIGAVGYFSRARILDTVGLVTPEISAYYPLDRKLLVEGANYAVPPEIIFDYRPDYIVLMEDFVHNGLARDDRFHELYAQVRFIPTDYYGAGMIMYQRRDLADS